MKMEKTFCVGRDNVQSVLQAEKVGSSVRIYLRKDSCACLGGYFLI